MRNKHEALKDLEEYYHNDNKASNTPGLRNKISA